ncbi:MAG: FISUMP domain-containing protein [Candidatus Neomarinimicrobiota bacterium]
MLNYKNRFILIISALIFSLSCSDDPTSSTNMTHETGTFTDIDGNAYQTIKIGNQWWMAENWKTTHATDGLILTGIFAYNDNENNVGEYGRLYTWQAALDAEPEGWHLPSTEEWNILEASLGSDAGAKLKVDGNSGFSAKLGGSRNYDGGYAGIDYWGMYWTSTVYTNDHSYIINLFSDRPDIVQSGLGIIAAISVRYVKD